MNLLEKQLSTVYFKDVRFPWVTLYNHIMVLWVVTCVNVGGYKCLKGTCQLHLQDQSEREKCVHDMKACDTEGADWDPQVEPDIWAAWFSETTIKKLNYKQRSLFNYPASYSDISIQWLDEREQMWTERPANCLRYYPSVYLEGLRRPRKKRVRTVGTPGKIQTGYHWIQARITTTADN